MPTSAAAGIWAKTSLAASPVRLLKAAEVALARLVLEKVSVYPVPGRFNVSPLNVATPFTAFTVTVPPSVAVPGFVPMATVTSPANDIAVLPNASCAVTTAPMGAPTLPPRGPVVIRSRDATTGSAFAETLSGEPESPVDVTVIACEPAVPPSFHDVLTDPSAAETAVAGVTDPPPAVTAKFTVTPATPMPSAASTRATIGCGSVLPAGALCAAPDAISMRDAGSMTATVALSLGPVRSCAYTLAVPRPTSVAAPEVELMVITPASELVKTIGVPAMVEPSDARATALKLAGCPAVPLRILGEIATDVALAPVPV